MSTTTNEQYRCGYVALVGRPNVGKSTLMNQVLGQKISIVTAKPQTTRQRITGIKTVAQGQVIYVDTPGIHLTADKALNRYMNRVAHAALRDIDLVLFMVEAGRFTDTDKHVRTAVLACGKPVMLVVNKIDLVTDKASLLPFVRKISEGQGFAGVFLVSALKSAGLDELEAEILKGLPFSQPYYDENQITDRSERFLAAELIREALTLRLHQELPYAVTVQIEAFERTEKITKISAVIWVERQGQKQIVIGSKGETLKQIGTESRRALELLLDEKVFLKLWVKVSRGWSDDENAIERLGYKDF
jgi:GTP-binding protein Era